MDVEKRISNMQIGGDNYISPAKAEREMAIIILSNGSITQIGSQEQISGTYTIEERDANTHELHIRWYNGSKQTLLYFPEEALLFSSKYRLYWSLSTD